MAWLAGFTSEATACVCVSVTAAYAVTAASCRIREDSQQMRADAKQLRMISTRDDSARQSVRQRRLLVSIALLHHPTLFIHSFYYKKRTHIIIISIIITEFLVRLWCITES